MLKKHLEINNQTYYVSEEYRVKLVYQTSKTSD